MEEAYCPQCNTTKNEDAAARAAHMKGYLCVDDAKPQNPLWDFTSKLPVELIRPIARWAHPITAFHIRAMCKATRREIKKEDIIWAQGRIMCETLGVWYAFVWAFQGFHLEVLKALVGHIILGRYEPMTDEQLQAWTGFVYTPNIKTVAPPATILLAAHLDWAGSIKHFRPPPDDDAGVGSFQLLMSHALLIAGREGNVRCIRELHSRGGRDLTRFSPGWVVPARTGWLDNAGEELCPAVVSAGFYGHTEVVKLLLTLQTYSEQVVKEAMELAVTGGKVGVFQAFSERGLRYKPKVVYRPQSWDGRRF
ncbi:hypothetical protein HDV00_009049 [Rhizophlyctis rosea]|nr:hypothetical protein HDV00_009049 [Rhizophlyctis rosea]